MDKDEAMKDVAKEKAGENRENVSTNEETDDDNKPIIFRLKRIAPIRIEEVSKSKKANTTSDKGSENEEIAAKATKEEEQEKEVSKSVFPSLIPKRKRSRCKSKGKMADVGNFNKRSRFDVEQSEALALSEKLWNTYKHGWCANPRKDQNTSP